MNAQMRAQMMHKCTSDLLSHTVPYVIGTVVQSARASLASCAESWRRDSLARAYTRAEPADG
jgi:hypothetical protein